MSWSPEMRQGQLSLSTLPDDILFVIVSHLTAKEFVHLILTSRHLYSTMNCNESWRALYEQHFASIIGKPAEALLPSRWGQEPCVTDDYALACRDVATLQNCQWHSFNFRIVGVDGRVVDADKSDTSPAHRILLRSAMSRFGAVIFGGLSTDDLAGEQPLVSVFCPYENKLYILKDIGRSPSVSVCSALTALGNDRFLVCNGITQNNHYGYEVSVLELKPRDGSSEPDSNIGLRDLKSLCAFWRKPEPCMVQSHEDTVTARWGHAAATFGDRYVAIFGGSKPEYTFSDLVVFDARRESMYWNTLHCKSAGSGANIL